MIQIALLRSTDWSCKHVWVQGFRLLLTTFKIIARVVRLRLRTGVYHLYICFIIENQCVHSGTEDTIVTTSQKQEVHMPYPFTRYHSTESKGCVCVCARQVAKFHIRHDSSLLCRRHKQIQGVYIPVISLQTQK